MKILSCKLQAIPSSCCKYSSMHRANSLYWRKKQTSRGYQYFVILGGMIFVCKYKSLFPRLWSINLSVLTRPRIQQQKRCSLKFRFQYFMHPGQFESCLHFTTGAVIIFYIWLCCNVSKTLLLNLPSIVHNFSYKLQCSGPHSGIKSNIPPSKESCDLV